MRLSTLRMPPPRLTPSLRIRSINSCKATSCWLPSNLPDSASELKKGANHVVKQAIASAGTDRSAARQDARDLFDVVQIMQGDLHGGVGHAEAVSLRVDAAARPVLFAQAFEEVDKARP